LEIEHVADAMRNRNASAISTAFARFGPPRPPKWRNSGRADPGLPGFRQPASEPAPLASEAAILFRISRAAERARPL
jgi:hypothetical protein